MKTARKTLLLFALACLSAPALAADTPGCTCHDAISPGKDAPVIDLRGWNTDGVHRQQGCLACHPGADQVPHHGKVLTVSCASCHEAEAKDWDQTVHGRAEGKNPEIHGCMTCHVEHTYFPANDPRYRYTNSGLLRTCVSCHQPTQMEWSFSMPVKDPPAGEHWPSCIHGHIVRGGQLFIAACSSCHGAHQVFPADDPRSAVNVANIEQNCGRCHENVDPQRVVTSLCVRRDTPSWYVSNYFDVWYLWTGGIAFLSVVGLLVMGMVGTALRRRKENAPGVR